MIIHLVWDGCEDVVAAFFSKEKAEAYIDKILENSPTRRPNWSITECEIGDAP